MNDAPYMVRHGDVLLVRVAEIPAQARKVASDRIAVLEGEVTGHVHELSGAVEEHQLHDGALAERFFAVLEDGGVLTHPEHMTIEMPPGSYRLQRQVEYVPEGARFVGD